MKIFILSLAVFALAFVLYVRWLEKTSIFYPDKQMGAVPLDAGLSYEDVHFKTPDGRVLHGWFVPEPSAKAVLLFLHGNAGNINGRIGKIALFRDAGLDVFIFDYRGYGQSEGVPSESNLYADTLAAFDYLKSREDTKAKRVVAYGESLGGVAAVDLAIRRDVGAIIIDSSFSSAVDMARVMYPFVPSFLLSVKMDSLSKIGAVPIPKLFLHSIEDATVPFDLGQKLFAEAVEPKKFIRLHGAHINGYLDAKDTFTKGIKDFLEQWGLI